MSMFGWLKGKAATPGEAKPAATAPAAPAAAPPEAPPPEAPSPAAPPPETSGANPVDAAGTSLAPAETEAANPAPGAAATAALDAEPPEAAAAAPVEASPLAEASPPTEVVPAEAEPSPEPAAPPAEAEPADAADPVPVVEAEPAPDAVAEAEPPPETPVVETPPAAPEPAFSLLAAVDQVMAEPSSWPEDPIPEPPRPNDTLEARLTLVRPGQPALELPVSAELLGSIIDNLPDHQAYEELYDLAAEHPSAQVRLAVARKDRLGEEAVRRLSEAREFYVLERLLASDQFRAQVSQERLIAILDLHPELARDVAGSYASFLNCAAGALLAYLGGHRDPGVRLALVENYSANAALLRRFSADPDPGVRAAAKRRLSEV
jgi:hypothetical protein